MKMVLVLILVFFSHGAIAGQLAPIGDADGRDLGESVTSAAGLHRACGYAQAMNGPVSGKLSGDESMLGMVCYTYLSGVLTTANLSGGFSSPSGSIRFCAPRADASISALTGAVISTGDASPELIAPGASIESLLIVALASLSRCKPSLNE